MLSTSTAIAKDFNSRSPASYVAVAKSISALSRRASLWHGYGLWLVVCEEYVFKQALILASGYRHESRCHLRQFLLPPEHNAVRYPIATSYLGETRIWRIAS